MRSAIRLDSTKVRLLFGLAAACLMFGCTSDGVADSRVELATPPAVVADVEVQQPTTSPTPTRAAEDPAQGSAGEDPTVAEVDDAVGLSELLQWVPLAALSSDTVEFGSFTRAAAAYGPERPGCDVGPDQTMEALRALAENDFVIGVPRFWTRLWDAPGDLRRSFGIDFCNVHGWADWIGPVGHTTVIRSSATQAQVDEAVLDDAEWEPVAELRETHNELTYWFWGDGLVFDVDSTSAARGVGQGGTLGAVADGIYVRSWDEAGHDASVLAGTAQMSVLADGDVSAIVTVLEEADVYRASLSRADNERGSLTWVAWGSTFDGETGATLVLSFDTEGAAIDALDRFEANLRADADRYEMRLNIRQSMALGKLAIFKLDGGEGAISPSFSISAALDFNARLFDFGLSLDAVDDQLKEYKSIVPNSDPTLRPCVLDELDRAGNDHVSAAVFQCAPEAFLAGLAERAAIPSELVPIEECIRESFASLDLQRVEQTLDSAGSSLGRAVANMVALAGSECIDGLFTIPATAPIFDDLYEALQAGTAGVTWSIDGPEAEGTLQERSLDGSFGSEITILSGLDSDKVAYVRIWNMSTPGAAAALDAIASPVFGIELPADGVPAGAGSIQTSGSDYQLCHSTPFGFQHVVIISTAQVCP